MRFTIGRLMLLIAGSALALTMVRVTGLGAGLVVAGWASLGGLAWLSCRRWDELVVYWVGFEAVGVVLIALGVGPHINWRAGLLAGVGVLVVLYPVHLGCGLGWRANARRVGRTSRDRSLERLIFVYILGPWAVFVAAVAFLLVALICEGR